MHKRWIALIILFAMALAVPSLYAPAPPPDSAFVRVINTSNASLNSKIGSVSLAENLGMASVGAYRVIKQGSHTISGAGKTQSLTLEAGYFYTLGWVDGNWVVIQDKTASSLAKARIGFYNFSSVQGVSLKTSDAKLTLFEGFTPNQYDMLQVNPVKVQLAVFAGSRKFELPLAQLQPNTAYSAVLIGSQANLKAIWVANTQK